MSRGSSGAKTAGGGLGTRIMVSMGTVLVLVTLLAVFCLYTVISQLPSAVPGQSVPTTASAPDQTAEKIATLSLEARTIEQQFRKQQTPASVVQFEEIGKKLLSQALELEKNAKQGNDPKKVQAGAQITLLLSQYTTLFRDLIQAWEVKGITEDAGLRQKLNQAALHLTPPADPERKTQGLEAALLQLGRAEQNYFAARGVENQRLLVTAVGNLSNAVGESGLAASELQAIRKSIKDYTAAFDRYQAVSLATSDPVLSATFAAEQVKQEETMHKASLELEKMISGLNASQGSAVMQTIQPLEQEYLKQGDAASAAQVSATLEEYNKSLDTAQIPPAEKTALKKAMAEYQTAFTALVEQDKRIIEQGAKLDKTFAELQAQIRPISTAAASQVPAKKIAFPLTPQLSLMIIAGSWLAIVLATLFLARMLTGSVTAPLQRMTNIAHRMVVQGDSSLTFPPEKNEFGSLASVLNALVRRQTANTPDGGTATAEMTAKTGELARLVQERVDHDDRLADAVAGREEVLARFRTAIEKMSADIESLSLARDTLTEQGRAVNEAATGCEQSVTATVEAEQAITQYAGQMATVINTFTDLAEQTSVTALNAAIKATRTGPQGSAFSAVTEELDHLAKRATETAKELAVLSQNMTSQIAAGNTLGNESRQALQHLATIGSTGQQTIDEIDMKVNGLRTAAGDVCTLLTELDEINTLAGSLVHKREPGDKEVGDNPSPSAAVSGPPAAGETHLDKEFAKVLQEFKKHETDQDRTAGSAGQGDRA